MAGQVVESMARPLKVVERVTPQQTLERCAHAGAAGLGDVHEQKLIAVGEQHPVFSSVLRCDVRTDRDARGFPCGRLRPLRSWSKCSACVPDTADRKSVV